MAMSRRSAADFMDTKRTFSFFFEKGRLRRIGVYLWEGKDTKQGVPAWRRAYELLQKDYGKVKIPDIQVSPKSEPVNADVLAFVAAGHAYATGNTQMAPVNQPDEMRVFARFMGAPFGNYFSVAIFFDPRP